MSRRGSEGKTFVISKKVLKFDNSFRYIETNCKKIILWGSVNEYNQHFCDEKCYEKYCKKNGYEAHPEKLYKIRSIFN